MKRDIIVAVFIGAAAAVVGAICLSLLLHLELRHTEFGAFIRAANANGAPDCSYGDPIDFMGKWVRIHQFVLSPVSSFVIGTVVGLFCRRLRWVALLLGVAPIVAVNCLLPDALSLLAAMSCVFAAWTGTRVAAACVHLVVARRQQVTTT